MKPRDYQADAIRECSRALKRHRSALVAIPTGGGKGAVIGMIVDIAARQGRRILVFVHRREIVDQLADHIRRWAGTEPAIEQAERQQATDESRVVVGSLQSLLPRLDRFEPSRFDLVIYDECHHACAVTPRQLLAHFAPAKVLGFTATPNRGDEKALGQIFDTVAYDMTLADAIKLGWLVPIKTRAIECPSLDLSKVRKRGGKLVDGDLGAVMSEVAVLREAIVPAVEIAGERQAIVFCVTIAHMHCVAETINEVAAERSLELPIAMVDGKTPKTARREIMQGFRDGRIRWLLNVGVATEGFDAPSAEVVLFLRPTLSRALFLQMGGRATRPLPGVVDGPETPEDRRAAIAASAKPSCLWLDFTDNSKKHDLASPIDLLGGDYSLPEQKEAERLLATGQADDLLAALESARAAHEAKLAAARARAGDPFALFGIASSKDRWSRPATKKQTAALGPMPRRLDFREANAVLEEMARRKVSGLAMYEQLALLARLHHPVEQLPTMTRAVAAKLVAAVAMRGWFADCGWVRLYDLAGVVHPGSVLASRR